MEYRYAGYVVSDSDFLVGYSNALAGVVVGQLAPDDIRFRLEDWCMQNTIPFGQIIWHRDNVEVHW